MHDRSFLASLQTHQHTCLTAVNRNLCALGDGLVDSLVVEVARLLRGGSVLQVSVCTATYSWWDICMCVCVVCNDASSKMFMFNVL